MSPFRNYGPVVPAVAWCSPFDRCAVCFSLPVQLRREFAAMISQSWSPSEIDLLSQAARAALL